MWKNFFNKEKENDANFISDDKNPLINKKQQLDLINNQNSNNIKMLNDLSLSEKTYLERELSFKYDCDEYKILKINRINLQYFDVECELFLNGKNLTITERIFYHSIKNKVEDF